MIKFGGVKSCFLRETDLLLIDKNSRTPLL